MRRSWISAIFLAGILLVPAWGNVNPARPGTLNYVEGHASIGSQTLDAKSIGAIELDPGQSLTTQAGKAEILLTPGVFLRLGDHSSVRMVSPDLANTDVRLEKGRALVEVATIYPENNLRVEENGATTQLMKRGLYDFDADRNEIRVFNGRALVQEGDRQVEVKGGREVTLNGGDALKAQKFDKKASEDGLYRWSSLRSSYLAQANLDAARMYVTAGPGWYGTGWYWDPWFSSYTFIPGNGIFYSPFGWGFYSPIVVYREPIGRYGFYAGPRAVIAPRAAVGFRGGFRSGRR